MIYFGFLCEDEHKLYWFSFLIVNYNAWTYISTNDTFSFVSYYVYWRPGVQLPWYC